jgi:hypothetical protein
MLVVDRDPRDVAGIDLIDQLLSLEVTDPSDGIVGRFRDRSDFGDFSTPLTQSLALMALSRAPGADPSAEAITALVDQACPDGGFPSQFAPDTCTSSVDTTGFVVQALFAVGEDVAASAAVSWLESVQAADGSFASPDGTNTNSTGLAAIALTLGGATDAAASAGEWIVSQQDGCDTDSPGAIPFNQQERGSVELASAQAVVGLVGESLADLSNAGARAEVPTLACETVGGTTPSTTMAAPRHQVAPTSPTSPGRTKRRSRTRGMTRTTMTISGRSRSRPVSTPGCPPPCRRPRCLCCCSASGCCRLG